MPQLDKYAFISEYFWLVITLLGIYYLSSFYILPLTLRNMLVRQNLTKFLQERITLTPYIPLYISEDIAPNFSAHKNVLYISPTGTNIFLAKYLKKSVLMSKSLYKIFLLDIKWAFKNVKSVLLIANFTTACKLVFARTFALVNFAKSFSDNIIINKNKK